MPALKDAGRPRHPSNGRFGSEIFLGYGDVPGSGASTASLRMLKRRYWSPLKKYALPCPLLNAASIPAANAGGKVLQPSEIFLALGVSVRSLSASYFQYSSSLNR